MSTVAIIAIQLEIDARVLASPEAYRAHLEAAAARGVEQAGPADARLIVYPEIAGHLALLALAPPAAHRTKTLGTALAAAALRHPLDVLRGVASARTLGPRSAVLAALAPDGDRYWRSVFGPLARRHRAWVVAGSHLRLSQNGDLTNASHLFAPDGRCVATTDKVNLVPGLEDAAKGALGLARGDVDRVPIVETPFGNVCTLICYDGFREPHTANERFVPVPPRIAARGGAFVVANPAANPWPWEAAWPFEPESGTRAEQWEREGLCASLLEWRFARIGCTAHLVGSVLDLSFDGRSEIVEADWHGLRKLARATTATRGEELVAAVTW